MYPGFPCDTLSLSKMNATQSIRSCLNKFFYVLRSTFTQTKRRFWMAFTDYTCDKTRNQLFSHIACNWFKAYLNRKVVQIHVAKRTENWALLYMYIFVVWSRFFHLSHSYTLCHHSVAVSLSIPYAATKLIAHSVRNKTPFTMTYNFIFDKNALFMQFN